MISLQFGYAGMYVITMLCLKKGMNHYVLAVYRHLVATIVISPFAFVLERFDLFLYYFAVYLPWIWMNLEPADFDFFFFLIGK